MYVVAGGYASWSKVFCLESKCLMLLMMNKLNKRVS